MARFCICGTFFDDAPPMSAPICACKNTCQKLSSLIKLWLLLPTHALRSATSVGAAVLMELTLVLSTWQVDCMHLLSLFSEVV